MEQITPDNAPSKCPRIESCIFFQKNAEMMPTLAEKLKQRFCLKDSSRCARLWILRELGPEMVPELLLPNQYDWAQQILCDAGKSSALYQTTLS